MRDCWKILGIEETKDRDLIKTAYREKLIHVNPEDDQDGFKRLREAYEQAIQLIGQEDALPEDNSVLGLWKKKLATVYGNFYQRISAPAWKQLLSDNVCQQLDSWNETRDEILEFLKEHFRLPYEIWKILDQQFHLSEDEKELREKYPANFIDYLLDVCSQPGMLDFYLFEGDPEADYDTYIDLYYQLKRIVDEEKDFPLELEQQMLELEIYYPYLEVEKVRSLLHMEKFEQAEALIVKLAQKHPQNDYIKYYQAQVFWQQQKYDQAKLCYEELLKENPRHFSAKLGMAEYNQMIGEYKKAKDAFIELLDIDHRHQLAYQGMQRTNEYLIKEYQQELQQFPDRLEIKLEYAWCLFQNEQFTETIELLDAMTPDEETEFDYYNLKGRTFLRMEDYQQALPYVTIWLDMLLNIDGNDSAEMKKRLRRLGYAHYAKADCYLKIYQDPDEEQQRQILELIDQSIKLEEDYGSKLSYLHGKAYTLLQWKHDKSSIDVCDQIIELSEGYFPAYVIRQEAYFNLGYYQNVIDDYYRATDMFANFLPPYLFAAKTFWFVDQYESGLNVVSRAEEQGLKSDELNLYKARFIRCLADSNDDSQKACDICLALKKRIDQEDFDIKDKSTVYAEMARCLMNLQQGQQALDEINMAITSCPDEDNHYYIKANILFQLNRYQEALALYQMLDQKLPNNALILFRLAQSQERMGKIDEAIKYYQQVISSDPDHPTVHHNLMGIYQRKWQDDEDNDDYQKAIEHASEQLRVAPEAYYYIERGLLYSDGKEYQKAIADFEQALTYDTHNVYAYSDIGVTYYKQRLYLKAKESLLKAVEAMDKPITTLAYQTLAKCYAALGEDQEAIHSYEKNISLFPDVASVYRDLARYYLDHRSYDEAIIYYQKGMKQKYADQSRYKRDLATVYIKMGAVKKALELYREILKADQDDVVTRLDLASFLFYHQRKYRQACSEYLTIIKQTQENDINSEYGAACCDLGICYHYLGRQQEANKYLQQSLKFYQRGNENFDRYLAYGGIPARLYRVIIVLYYLGEMEQVNKYYQQMKAAETCSYCEYRDCFELLIIEGLLRQAAGEIDQAKVLLQQACDISDNADECKFLLGQLTEKKKWRFRLW